MDINFYGALSKGRLAFDRIAGLQQQILHSDDSEVYLYLHATERTGLTFVFLLACMPLMGEDYGKQLYIRTDRKIYQLMKRIHAVEFYNTENKNIDRPCFRRIRNQGDIFRLVTEIGGEAPVQMTEELADIMVSKMGEMYINALDHSEAKTIIGGKYFKQNSRYCFCCYDSGIGIPQKVRRFLQETRRLTDLSDLGALEWALKLGNSTIRESGIPRGVGLHTLQSFAKANDGAIRICTGKAFYEFRNGIAKTYALQHSFVGTLFEMDILQDNMHKYILG